MSSTTQAAPPSLVDLLGVLITSFFTSLLGVIVVKDFLKDSLLNLLPWFLAVPQR